MSIPLNGHGNGAVQREAEAVLRAERLTRLVGEKRIVDDISVAIARGDVVAIVGPSGAGKSSFLRLLNRLDEPTGGTVYLDGRDYRELPPRELRRKVGMVMQSAHLFPGTVGDNLRFGPQSRGETIADADIEQLLEQVGLAGYAGRDVARLSGGEAQRVSLARTLANHPEILLLDEPTSALDEAAKGDVEALLRQVMARSDLTCLIITHDMAQASRLASRVMTLRQGKLESIGPVEEVLHA